MIELKYKFKSKMSFDVLKLTQDYLTVREFKDLICKKHSAQTTGFTLKLNEWSGKQYNDDDSINLNEKIIVSRIPKTDVIIPKTNARVNSLEINEIKKTKVKEPEPSKSSPQPKKKPETVPKPTEIPKCIQCNFCHKIMTNPTRIKCCNKDYCYTCITGFLFDPDVAGGHECPDCHTMVSSTENCLIPNALKEKLVKTYITSQTIPESSPPTPLPNKVPVSTDSEKSYTDIRQMVVDATAILDDREDKPQEELDGSAVRVRDCDLDVLFGPDDSFSTDEVAKPNWEHKQQRTTTYDSNVDLDSIDELDQILGVNNVLDEIGVDLLQQECSLNLEYDTSTQNLIRTSDKESATPKIKDSLQTQKGERRTSSIETKFHQQSKEHENIQDKQRISDGDGKILRQKHQNNDILLESCKESDGKSHERRRLKQQNSVTDESSSQSRDTKREENEESRQWRQKEREHRKHKREERLKYDKFQQKKPKDSEQTPHRNRSEQKDLRTKREMKEENLQPLVDSEQEDSALSKRKENEDLRQKIESENELIRLQEERDNLKKSKEKELESLQQREKEKSHRKREKEKEEDLRREKVKEQQKRSEQKDLRPKREMEVENLRQLVDREKEDLRQQIESENELIRLQEGRDNLKKEKEKELEKEKSRRKREKEKEEEDLRREKEKERQYLRQQTEEEELRNIQEREKKQKEKEELRIKKEKDHEELCIQKQKESDECKIKRYRHKDEAKQKQKEDDKQKLERDRLKNLLGNITVLDEVVDDPKQKKQKKIEHKATTEDDDCYLRTAQNKETSVDNINQHPLLEHQQRQDQVDQVETVASINETIEQLLYESFSYADDDEDHPDLLGLDRTIRPDFDDDLQLEEVVLDNKVEYLDDDVDLDAESDRGESRNCTDPGTMNNPVTLTLSPVNKNGRHSSPIKSRHIPQTSVQTEQCSYESKGSRESKSEKLKPKHKTSESESCKQKHPRSSETTSSPPKHSPESSSKPPINQVEFDPMLYMQFLSLVKCKYPDELKKILSNGNVKESRHKHRQQEHTSPQLPERVSRSRSDHRRVAEVRPSRSSATNAAPMQTLGNDHHRRHQHDSSRQTRSRSRQQQKRPRASSITSSGSRHKRVRDVTRYPDYEGYQQQSQPQQQQQQQPSLYNSGSSHFQDRDRQRNNAYRSRDNYSRKTKPKFR